MESAFAKLDVKHQGSMPAAKNIEWKLLLTWSSLPAFYEKITDVADWLGRSSSWILQTNLYLGVVMGCMQVRESDIK